MAINSVRDPSVTLNTPRHDVDLPETPPVPDAPNADTSGGRLPDYDDFSPPSRDLSEFLGGTGNTDYVSRYTGTNSAGAAFERTRTVANGGSDPLDDFEVPFNGRGFGGLGVAQLTAAPVLMADGNYKSAKHTMMQAAYASGTIPKNFPGDKDKSRETATAYFNKYLRPELEAQGFEVLDVHGDLAVIRTRENPDGTLFDWLGNMAGEDGSTSFEWQPVGDFDAQGNFTKTDERTYDASEVNWLNGLIGLMRYQRTGFTMPSSGSQRGETNPTEAAEANRRRENYRGTPFRNGSNANALSSEATSAAMQSGVLLSPNSDDGLDTGMSVRGLLIP